MSGRGRVLVGAVAVLVVVVASVLVWRGRGSAEPLGPELLVVGDSVTYIAAGDIQAAFAPVKPEFVARPGYTSGQLLPYVREAIANSGTPASQLQRVVVLVGYNDVRVRELSGDALPDLVRESSRFRCAVWLTLPSRPGGKVATNDFVPSDLVDRWNRRLAQEVARYDNVHLATDWADAVTAAPASELLRADGVHPIAAGQLVLADAYATAVARSCPDG